MSEKSLKRSVKISWGTALFGLVVVAGTLLPAISEWRESSRIHKLRTVGVQLFADVEKTTVVPVGKGNSYAYLIDVRYQAPGNPSMHVGLYTRSAEIYNQATGSAKIMITYLPENPSVSELTAGLPSAPEEDANSWFWTPVTWLFRFGYGIYLLFGAAVGAAIVYA